MDDLGRVARLEKRRQQGRLANVPLDEHVSAVHLHRLHGGRDGVAGIAMLREYKLIPVLLCFVFFLLFYGLTSRADLQVSDEVSAFASGIFLESRGNLVIDQLQWLEDTSNISLGETGRDGHLYSKYFPGNILSASIIYKLTKTENDQPYIWNVPPNLNAGMDGIALAASNTGARLALRANAIFGALAMTALFLLSNRYFTLKTSLATVLLVGICSDWWYQSRGFLSEVGAGAFLIASLYFAAGKKPYASGFSLGLSLLFRPTNILALPVWGKAVIDKGRKAIWSGFGILAGLAVLGFFNWIRFGSMTHFGYGNENFTPNLFLGLLGILFSPGRSLFIYSPILVLAIPGAWSLYKREKRLALLAAWMVLSYVVMIAAWHNWDGGWTWGSRLLTPIVPILGFLTAPIIETIWNRKGDMLVIILLALLGLGVQLLALAKDPVETLVNFVVYGGINYNQTIFTFNNAWVSLQARSLQTWQFCDLDAYTLRQWFGNCP